MNQKCDFNKSLFVCGFLLTGQSDDLKELANRIEEDERITDIRRISATISQ